MLHKIVHLKRGGQHISPSPPPITPFSPLYLYPSIDQAFISLLEFESKRRRKDFYFFLVSFPNRELSCLSKIFIQSDEPGMVDAVLTQPPERCVLTIPPAFLN